MPEEITENQLSTPAERSPMNIASRTDRPRRAARAMRVKLGVCAATGLAIALGLAACGGSSPSASASSGSTGTAKAPSAAGGANGSFGPAASGLIAALSGSTMQVQSQQDGQVAVSWTSSTTFTQQVSAAASSIKAGDCVTAMGSSTANASTSASFTATTVSITPSVNGTCGGGDRGTGGVRPSGAPAGGMPSGAPGGMPPGGATGAVPSGAHGSGAGRPGEVASGAVVSVSGSKIVIAARDFGGAGAGASANAGTGANGSASSSATTTNRTVTLASTTKITTEKSVTSSAVKVGLCASAQGTTDSTGAVTAKSVALTDAVDGACTSGFGGFGGFGRGGNGASAPSNTTGGAQ